MELDNPDVVAANNSVSSMSKSELQLQIYRNQKLYTRCSVYLPDGGAKLRDKLQALKDEFKRRSQEQLEQCGNKKRRLVINYDDLFGHSECDKERVVPPNSWIRSRRQKSRKATEDDFSSMPDGELQKAIDSNESLFATCSNKLPDGGAKLCDKLQSMKDELKSRQHRRSQEHSEQCGNENLAFQQNRRSHSALKIGLDGSCLLEICRLLRNSRFLEEVTLYIDVDFFCDCNMLMQELASPCEMHYLKTATIRGFEKPCKTLIQLIEFLLKNAVVLDKLVIVCNNKEQLTSTKGSEFVLELLSLPRASKNAKVVVV